MIVGGALPDMEADRRQQGQQRVDQPAALVASVFIACNKRLHGRGSSSPHRT